MITRLIIIATLCFVTAVPTSVPASDTADELVELPLRWKLGDRLEYEIVKTRQTTQDAKLTLQSRVRTRLSLKVDRADAEGYRVVWTQGKSRFENPEEAAHPLARRMANLFDGFQIVLTLDSGAIIQRVENWKEIQTRLETVLNALIDELNQAGADPRMVAGVRQQIERMFATQSHIENHCTREAQLFFLVLGGRYSKSNPTVYEDRLPNPLGGEPLPSRAEFSLETIDRKKQRAVVAWKQAVIADRARPILERTMKALAAHLDQPKPEGLKTFSIDDTARFTVDLSSGWLEQLRHTRRTTTGEKTDTVTLTITRKPHTPAPG